MALKAGRVGVAPTEVDEFGHVLGGSGDSYTKEEADSKFATKSNTYTKSGADNKFESKENIGGFQFRDNDGTAQYKTPSGDWANFSSGGGFNLLWSNPSPSTGMGNTTVELDLTEYEAVMIEFNYDIGESSIKSRGVFVKSNTVQISGSVKPSGGTDWCSLRRVNSVSDSGVTFGIGLASRADGGSYGPSDNSNACIPVKIYGIKSID